MTEGNQEGGGGEGGYTVVVIRPPKREVVVERERESPRLRLCPPLADSWAKREVIWVSLRQPASQVFRAAVSSTIAMTVFKIFSFVMLGLRSITFF